MSRTISCIRRIAFASLAMLVFGFAVPAFAKQGARNTGPRNAQPAAPQRQQALPTGYVRPPMNPPSGLAPKMRVAELPTADSHTYRISFSTGDEILSGLTEFAEQHHIVSARVSGIGGLISAKLGWGSPTVPGMKEFDVAQKCELVSLTGLISMRGQHPYVHLHGVVAFSDGSTRGGHVIEAHVDPLAEIFVITTAAPLPPEDATGAPER
ncbi:MAG: DUF296 domain-containing protein [Acidobacteriota bacterium]|nr:DUF296 domain-containing protein [Acidobacteriota bacterium]